MNRTGGFLLSALAVCAAHPTAGQTSPAEERRVRILVNGAYSPTETSFSEASTFTQFLEEGSSRRSYDGGKGAVFEGGVIVGITRGFGVMGSVEIFESDFDGVFEESLPHPLLFNQPRVVEGSSTELAYREKAIHLGAVLTRAFSGFTVDLFGGPTMFFTNTEVLNAVSTSSQYPFDEAVVTGTSRVTLDDNPVGFHGGGAFTWRLTEVFGLAFQARYSRASIAVAREGGDAIGLDAGGFRVGGGIRLAF